MAGLLIHWDYMIGQTLSHFKITAKLGEGGMGEVYRAEDKKLGREVAIKVLPDEFARDKERLARFEREARLLAQLNHSNIATLHGLEEHDGQKFLVMELVEGETLAERIAKGPIPLDETIPLFIQIAEGLEAAHEKAIIHRDLKPANIKVGPDGKPKILDFGLAKAFVGHEVLAQDSTQSPTLTKGTALGTIMGTASYMSPEQARGKQVDKRTDIWAFGVCLFEALAGRRPFEGETVTDTMAAVVNREPNWNALVGSTPSHVRTLIKRCLRKDSRTRLRDIGEARIQLEEGRNETLDEPARRSGVAWRAAIAMVLAAVVLTWFIKPSRISLDLPVANLRVGLQPVDKLRQFHDKEYPLMRGAIALSDDGRSLAFTGGTGKRPNLYVRRLDESEAVAVPGTDGAMGPFFSPDGQWIGFWADQVLKKVRIAGGPPQALCDVAIPPNGASWGLDGTILFGASEKGILSVSSDGGAPELITTLEPDEESHGHPYFLPSGKAILYTVGKAKIRGLNAEDAKIIVETLDTGERKVLVDNAADGRYVPTGHLVFLRVGTLMAAPFDPDRLELTGAPIAIRDDVHQDINLSMRNSGKGTGQFSFSSTGWLAYVSGGVSPVVASYLHWVERDGTSTPLEAPTGSYWTPRISPDGRRIVVNKDDDIWAYDIPGQTWSRVTSPETRESRLAWSPDGKITFLSDKDGPGFSIYQQTLDQGGSFERLTEAGPLNPASWSPDGQVLAVVRRAADRTADIWMLPKGREPVPFIEEPAANIRWPEFSPDGRWLAYGASDTTGVSEVYVVPYPGPGPRIQISTDGGASPTWARDGRELFFTKRIDAVPDGEKELMAVTISGGSELQVGRPRRLFSRRMRESVPTKSYDVSPDGERFLIVDAPDRKFLTVTEIHVVVNWFDELKRLVPTNN